MLLLCLWWEDLFALQLQQVSSILFYEQIENDTVWYGTVDERRRCSSAGGHVTNSLFFLILVNYPCCKRRCHCFNKLKVHWWSCHWSCLNVLNYLPLTKCSDIPPERRGASREKLLDVFVLSTYCLELLAEKKPAQQTKAPQETSWEEVLSPPTHDITRWLALADKNTGWCPIGSIGL